MSSDPRALAVAVQMCFQILAEKRPLVLAIDDSHWVDRVVCKVRWHSRLRCFGAPSAYLLLFALRLDESAEVPRWRTPSTRSRRAPARRPAQHRARHALLQRRRGRRSRVRRCVVSTRFRGATRSMRSSSLVSLDPQARPSIRWSRFRFRGRWSGWWAPASAGLDGATREALLVIAAHGRPSPALLAAAGISPNTLEPAFAAQGGRALDRRGSDSAHPLLSSVLDQEASDQERRGAHGRLATVADDPVERARHLAFASERA